jgi:hypothetical protein
MKYFIGTIIGLILGACLMVYLPARQFFGVLDRIQGRVGTFGMKADDTLTFQGKEITKAEYDKKKAINLNIIDQLFANNLGDAPYITYKLETDIIPEWMEIIRIEGCKKYFSVYGKQFDFNEQESAWFAGFINEKLKNDNC